MSPLLLFVGASALFLAFSNGANDNFKGFATVWGAHSLGYRQSLWLATMATAAGSFASLLLAHGLVAQFSGKGLVSDAAVADPAFIASVGLAAAATVTLATRVGMPVSTTHALLGALVGGGLASGSGTINVGALGQIFVLPLIVSPVVAALLGVAAYRLLRRGGAKADCACVAEAEPAVALAGVSAARAMSAPPRIVIGSDADCDELGVTRVRFSVPVLMERLNILSAVAICFARSVNDTPKLAALFIAARLSGLHASVTLVALMMAAGGLLLARRVAETMSLRISHMDGAQGASANLITAALVLFASRFGMPVSTTHVSVGSIAGTGAGAGTLDRVALRAVLLSWVATLPCAAVFAWAIAGLAHWAGV